MEDNTVISIGDYNLRKDTFYVICPAKIGDTVVTASMVSSFKAQKNVNRVCLIVKEAHRDIPDFFDEVDEKLVSDDFVEFCTGFTHFYEIWQFQNYLYARAKAYIKYWPQNIYTEVAEWRKRWKSGDMYNNRFYVERMIFDIDERSEFEEIKFKRNSIQENCQNSIILMPHSYTYQKLPISFWEKVSKRLAENGYTVYTNTKDETEYIIKGTYAFSKSLAIFLHLLKSAVYSLRQ